MAWHKFLAAGLVGSVAIIGCTVTSDTHVGTEGGLTGSGGGSSGGATGTGGGSTGGAKATGGGTGSGGKAAGGGTGTGGADTDSGPPNGCTVCLQAKCATEFTDCKADPVCLEVKATHAEGELQSIQKCMFRILGDAGAGIFTAADLAQCAGDNAVGATLADATDALIRCAHGAEDGGKQPCTTECFGDEVPFN